MTNLIARPERDGDFRHYPKNSRYALFAHSNRSWDMMGGLPTLGWVGSFKSRKAARRWRNRKLPGRISRLHDMRRTDSVVESWG